MNADRRWIDKLFSVSITLIIDVLSLLTLGVLIYATAALGYGFYDAIVAWESGKLRHLAIDIFTVLVFIEVTLLFRHFGEGSGVVLREVIEISFLLVMREFALMHIEGAGDGMRMVGYAAVLATLSVAWWLVRKATAEEGRAVAESDR